MLDKDPSNWDSIIKAAQFGWVLLWLPFKLLWDRISSIKNETITLNEKITKKIDENIREIQKTQLHAANEYISKAEFIKSQNDIEKLFDAKIDPIIKTLDEIKSIINR